MCLLPLSIILFFGLPPLAKDMMMLHSISLCEAPQHTEAACCLLLCHCNILVLCEEELMIMFKLGTADVNKPEANFGTRHQMAINRKSILFWRNVILNQIEKVYTSMCHYHVMT